MVPTVPNRAGRLVSEITAGDNEKYVEAVEQAKTDARVLHTRIKNSLSGWRMKPVTFAGTKPPVYVLELIGSGARGFERTSVFDIGPETSDKEFETVGDKIFEQHERAPSFPVIYVLPDPGTLRRMVKYLSRGMCPTFKYEMETIIRIKFTGMRHVVTCELIP